MNFYVASSRTQIEHCKSLIRMIHSYGHKITFNWTHPVEEGGEGCVRVHWRDHEKEAVGYSQRELAGVDAADRLVFWLPPDGTGRGCYWEAGRFSHKLDKGGEIWILNYEAYNADLVFFYHPRIHKMDMREFERELQG